MKKEYLFVRTGQVENSSQGTMTVQGRRDMEGVGKLLSHKYPTHQFSILPFGNGRIQQGAELIRNGMTHVVPVLHPYAQFDHAPEKLKTESLNILSNYDMPIAVVDRPKAVAILEGFNAQLDKNKKIDPLRFDYGKVLKIVVEKGVITEHAFLN